MKRSILFLMAICAVLIFAACEDDFIADVTEVNETDTLTIFNEDIEIKRNFKGNCNFVSPEPNTWYDKTNDWRTTGTTIWVTEYSDTNTMGGSATLYVGAKNKYDENRGVWKMRWRANLVSGYGGVTITASATGTGISGEVKGMNADWNYTMNFKGDDFPNPTNPTFFYEIEGNILKPQVPHNNN